MPLTAPRVQAAKRTQAPSRVTAVRPGARFARLLARGADRAPVTPADPRHIRPPVLPCPPR